MTQLDQAIRDSLQGLANPQSSASSFSLDKYIHEFRSSAREKAKAVMDLLAGKNFPLPNLRPVFVSIGGGDGEELDFLLRNTQANKGVLIEFGRSLAATARDRNRTLPTGKSLEVFEGDAKEKVVDAIQYAQSVVADGDADYLAVTCHAVIHELFDRGRDKFDPVAFFASIFSDVDVPTWFTYREPGAPEKWPDTVLLRAACSPHSLLQLAEAIRARHLSLRELRPMPQVIGDHVRLHRTLAMEVLAKLFYLPDLQHEIEERSTAVDHTILSNTLWLAIGETAQRENRASITSFSAPTTSFEELWRQFGVSVRALNPDSTTAPLAIPESQTRLVAWRLSPASVTAEEAAFAPESPVTSDSAGPVNNDLALAFESFNRRDMDLLNAILVSKGRSWIESSEKATAIKFLRSLTSKLPEDNFAHLWAHYLVSIATLFAGEDVSAEMFSDRLAEIAGPVGLSQLFRAERMEFFRKRNSEDEAVAIANTLLPVISRGDLVAPTSIGHYALGTCNFLMGSLLRYGGLYREAWNYIERAENIYQPGVASHDTELAHCYYAKAVCAAMTGVSNFDAPFDVGGENTRQFASALIQLSYSHAAWFLGDVARSRQYALDAASAFDDIGAPRYAKRAEQLSDLLNWWESLRSGERPQFDDSPSTYARAVAALTEHTQEMSWISSWIPSLRPSKALGLLQFAKEYSPVVDGEAEIILPRTLEISDDGSLSWRGVERARSLREADSMLRDALSIPPDRRIPLLAD